MSYRKIAENYEIANLSLIVEKVEGIYIMYLIIILLILLILLDTLFKDNE